VRRIARSKDSYLTSFHRRCPCPLFKRVEFLLNLDTTGASFNPLMLLECCINQQPVAREEPARIAQETPIAFIPDRHIRIAVANRFARRL